MLTTPGRLGFVGVIAGIRPVSDDPDRQDLRLRRYPKDAVAATMPVSCDQGRHPGAVGAPVGIAARRVHTGVVRARGHRASEVGYRWIDAAVDHRDGHTLSLRDVPGSRDMKGREHPLLPLPGL